MTSSEKKPRSGPYKPTLILHGGAGGISRASVPPELWARYRASLLKYLTVTKELLDSGASALDTACHAVTLLEDDVLFNCGRGSVFTERGTIEMEASVMVCSINSAAPPQGGIKRGAAVSLIRNTRHPILLAKEVLLSPDDDGGLGGTSTMHCHLSGRDVEEWGWGEKGLEKKPDDWFWTQRRWDEHRRGLKRDDSYSFQDLLASVNSLSASSQGDDDDLGGVKEYPSQGTVGAVCLDSWGNLAVATSTGGLTNKKVGRIGDTPTMGSGFWAENLVEDIYYADDDRSWSPGAQFSHLIRGMPVLDQLWTQGSALFGSCLGETTSDEQHSQHGYATLSPTYNRTFPLQFQPAPLLENSRPVASSPRPQGHIRRYHAVALSGTGNGDSFIRTNACRTAAMMCYLQAANASLAKAINIVAGKGGVLQLSAGDRFGKTGEGEGGIIGIEVVEIEELDDEGQSADSKSVAKKKTGTPVFDFNCGGLFRAYYETNEDTGKETPKVMVFREEY